jgi:phosphatidylglycerophosphate synthase
MHKPTLQEIRDKCQQVHKGDIAADIVRIFSVYFTWLGVRLGISANQASVFNIFVSVFIGISFFIGGTFGYLAAIFLLLLSTILDGVDGELARYWEKTRLTGLLLDRLNSIFFYSLPFIGMIGGRIETGDSPVPLYIAFMAAWGMLAIRLVKTNIDSCIVDALTLSKARIDASSDKFTGNFTSGAAAIRNKGGILWWLIDFVLVRQVGFVLPVILATLAEISLDGYGPSVGGLTISPLVLVVLMYAVLSTAALIYGIIDFSRKEIVERNYFSLRAQLMSRYGSESQEN